MRIGLMHRVRILLCTILLLAVPRFAPAQNPETMLPDESARKARQLVDQMIAALGGSAYLGVRDVMCQGRISLFGHAGDLTGYEVFRDYWSLPDKNRTEHGKKGNIIDIENGNRGWTLDRGGVTELSAEQVKNFQEQTKRDLGHLLRFGLKEEGLTFRYGGSDIVDLKQIDWVEIMDRDRRTFRIAIDRGSHLPVRTVVSMRNPETRETSDELTYYSDYHAQTGVQTPYQITRERDGRKIYQAFLDTCNYNSGLTEDLFSRSSLEGRNAATAKKNKKEKR